MKEVTVMLDSDKPYRIALSGDGHIGIDGADEEKNDCMYDMVRTGRRTLFLGMGDYLEFRPPRHKFFDAENNTMTLDEQLDWLFERWEEVANKGKFVGCIIGNHEEKLCKVTTVNPLRRWCVENKQFYLDYTAFVRFLFPSGEERTMVVTHGHSNATTKGAKMNRLSNFARLHDVDAVCMGHTHELVHWIQPSFKYQNGRQVIHNKALGYTGTFLRTTVVGTTGYGERNGMEPLPLGFLWGTIDPDNAQIELREEAMV